jgi:L-ascorbate metabolism protein UlaG (beta-lactamase superfamily)
VSETGAVTASPEWSSAAPGSQRRSHQIEPAPRISVTWMGHSTVLVEVDGIRILTDPLLTRRLVHLRRRAPTPTVRPVDAVLVSHVHMDHLHLPSLRRSASGARLIVPEGAARLVRKIPARSIEEVRRGAVVRVRDPASGKAAIDVEVVHAHHLSGRGPHSRVSAPPVGYVVRVAGRAVYFAGDTDLFDGMRALGPLDVALLPIWGWGRTLGERHLNPKSAATATGWLDPTTAVPIHWGTYSALRIGGGRPAWIDQPPHAFRDALADLGLEDRLCVLQPGGSLQIDTAADVK